MPASVCPSQSPSESDSDGERDMREWLHTSVHALAQSQLGMQLNPSQHRGACMASELSH